MKNIIRKVINEHEIYDNNFFTHCYKCGERIIVDIPYPHRHLRVHKSFSCNHCVPEKSAVRNGIDESIYTDISKSIWKEN